MASMTLEQFAEVVTDKNFDGNYTRTMYEQTPAEYPEFVYEKRVPGQFLTKMGGMQGMAAPIENRDEELLPFTLPVKSYTVWQTPKFYRMAWSIERALIEFTQDGASNALDNLQDVMASQKTLRDRRAASLLNNGFTAQGYEPVERDGTRRALFSTAHVREDGGATTSNYYNVAVPPNLDTIYEVGMNYLALLTDNVGNYVNNFTGEITIITPASNPAFVKAADVIVASMDDPSTANRAVNTARTRFRLKHISLRHLTSTTKWFMMVNITNKSPLIMYNYSDPQVSPLREMANNPDVMFSRIRSVFNVGVGPTFRGIVAIGS